MTAIEAAIYQVNNPGKKVVIKKIPKKKEFVLSENPNQHQEDRDRELMHKIDSDGWKDYLYNYEVTYDR